MRLRSPTFIPLRQSDQEQRGHASASGTKEAADERSGERNFSRIADRGLALIGKSMQDASRADQVLSAEVVRIGVIRRSRLEETAGVRFGIELVLSCTRKPPRLPSGGVIHGEGRQTKIKGP